MATYAQLEAEPYWGRELVTPAMDWLGDELCRRGGRPRAAAGVKGDRYHLRGAHRSQEWIKRSKYCTNRSYTVQSGLTAEQERHIAGVDFVPGEWGSTTNRRLMVEQTGRLVTALKAGRLAGVREVIGTLDGRTVVGVRPDGSTFSSDDSHLEHWHLTIDRRRCADRPLMERILGIALGLEDDVSAEDVWEGTRWTGADGKTQYTASTWVRMANTYAARAWEEAKAVRAGQAAILAAIEGLDTDAVLAEIQRVAAADAQRDAELAGLVRAGQSGQLAAEEVLRRMGEILAAGAATAERAG